MGDTTLEKALGCPKCLFRDNFKRVRLKKKEEYKLQTSCANQFVYVRRGEVVLRDLFGEDILVSKRCFSLFSFEGEVCLQAVKKADVLILGITQTQQLVAASGSFAERRGNAEVKSCSCNKASHLLVLFFENLFAYMKEGTNSLKMCQLKEQEFFLVLMQSYSAEKLSLIFAPILKRITDFELKVMRYLKSANTVSELSDKMGMERSHFQKVFKMHFGTSPYQWILQQKAELTLKFLRESPLPLKVIAEELGFCSQSHLNKFCKMKFGKTAKQTQRTLATYEDDFSV